MVWFLPALPSIIIVTITNCFVISAITIIIIVSVIFKSIIGMTNIATSAQTGFFLTICGVRSSLPPSPPSSRLCLKLLILEIVCKKNP